MKIIHLLKSLLNDLNIKVGKKLFFSKRNYVEYVYHIVVTKNNSLKVNDCFNKMCKTRTKPFVLSLASKGSFRETHCGAISLLESEVKVFEIILGLDSPGVFWWKLEKESQKLDDCNDADCFVYIGEKMEAKQLFRKAGFIIIS